jgi:hypothetical protein
MFALWYIALGAFKLAFPQCSAGGFDFSRVVCLIGGKDYGPLYHEVVMFSFLALAPLAITFLILCFVLETGLHEARGDAGGERS